MVYGGSGPTGWQEATRGREEEGGFKGGKMKCKFSSMMITDGDRHHFVPTEKPRLLVPPFSLYI